MSEKQQLQQKLKLDRTQWQRLLQLQQQQQEASTSQLYNLLTNHAADVTAMNLESQQQEDAFNAEYTKYVVPSHSLIAPSNEGITCRGHVCWPRRSVH